ASTGGAATGGTGGTGGTTGGTGGTGGATPTCTPVTVTGFVQYAGNKAFATLQPNVAGADPDILSVEFYGASAGTTDLSVSPDDNFETCERCLRGTEDITQTTSGREYFQSAGSMNLLSADGSVGSFTNVTLVEVTIDPVTFRSTPVSGGQCLTIQQANWSWSCTDGGTEFSGANACGNCINNASVGCCSAESDACDANAECVALVSCVNGCSDQTCTDNCGTAHPSGIPDYNPLVDCLFGSTDAGACGTACQ
ncbi:MAG: hypothetical protein H6718_16345, partial [Polyangiaceae bacterium]|nr:hypothetical protein [Polyangiaceae bacterium]